MKRPLEPYAAKRTFTRTPEPGAEAGPVREGPLLFVVQKHAARRLHYDFRLELEGVLKSWAVPKGPSLTVGDKRMAVEVEDHPFDYASFEGVIPSKQYGAGNVIVWDCGVYSPDEDQEYSFTDRVQAEERMRRGLSAGKLSIFLRGEKLKGSFALVRTREARQWLLIKHKDRFVGGGELLARSHSVLSDVTVEDGTSLQSVQRTAAGALTPSGPAETMPSKLSPMLAEIGATPRSGPEWLYEPKLDGYRVIAFVRGSTVGLQSRRGIDLTAVFPDITADLAQQAGAEMILDGEIVALGPDGRPSFNALQNRAQLKTAAEIATAVREAPAVLVCFDLLHFAGVNLRGAPYVDRRRYLAQCLLTSARIQLVHVSTEAEPLYAAATASGFEGIVAKRKSSVYQPGKRSGSWLKYKTTRTAEFVVGGYTQGKGERESLGALLLGYWADGKLRYAGHAGSGLTEPVITDIAARAATLARRSSPFADKVQLHRPTRWLAPELVAEVTFADWTPDGLLRAPVFLRLRDDIPPQSVTGGPGPRSRPDAEVENAPAARSKGGSARSRGAARSSLKSPRSEIEAIVGQLDNDAARVDLVVEGARIRLTNLDRIYWPPDPDTRTPATTKRDLIRYLAKVSPCMLPHLADRPLTMIRMPEGIHGERFFQKHWEQALPDFVETVTVYSGHKEEKHRYLLANNLPTLLWLGQNGTLEFHIWHSRARPGADCVSQSTDYASSMEALEESVLNYPDYLVFDIDPYIYSGKEAKGAEPELNARGFAVGRRVAFWLRALLREMSLDAVVKTSGKTGLHVFVPIERTVTFEAARHICETVGRHLMRAHPKDITLEWAVEKRTDRIFIDYNMNVRGKTLNVAYSPRGQPGAPVSMPLTWEELEAAEVMDFTIRTVPGRLEKTGDRWQDALSGKYSLTKAFGRRPDRNT
ncbi:MAG TPA: non-homologous end-joining DNA ligase [Steroidobacteraceae bacterium]|nr:non-homologous end-joining DNA ligase [Steroidobacteraceae bacterium]